SEGVSPTIGQTLGGWANKLEEKAQSLPIMGDMIAGARNKAKEQFNTAAINRAVAPIGVKIEETGQAGVTKAGNALSKAYDDALGSFKSVTFDNTFMQKVAKDLDPLAANLVRPMREQFKTILHDVVGNRTTSGTLRAQKFRDADEHLGELIRDFSSSSVGSERQLGKAVQKLQELMRDQLERQHPEAGNALKAANEGWANLVRVEGASKLAKNSEGVFTPGMLNSAIQTADKSVRKRAVSRGEALMQDLGNAGQNVLGNKVPDSGTAGRLMLGAGSIAA